MIVADTDVLIDYLGGVEPGAGRVAEGIEAATLHTTAVSRFELLSGARTPRQRPASWEGTGYERKKGTFLKWVDTPRPPLLTF